MLSQEQIRELIPHSGTMCLLDGVIAWDETVIRCRSRSHRLPSNPLRRPDGLSAIHLIEYGAQAMAIHGGLLARTHGSSGRPGYLAAIRQVELYTRTLDDVDDDLTIEAERLLDDHSHFLYAFRASAGDRLLAVGRTTVITR